jgi:hypothetical protein
VFPTDTVPCTGKGTFVTITGPGLLAATRCSLIGIKANVSNAKPTKPKKIRVILFIVFSSFVVFSVDAAGHVHLQSAADGTISNWRYNRGALLSC